MFWHYSLAVALSFSFHTLPLFCDFGLDPHLRHQLPQAHPNNAVQLSNTNLLQCLYIHSRHWDWWTVGTASLLPRAAPRPCMNSWFSVGKLQSLLHLIVEDLAVGVSGQQHMVYCYFVPVLHSCQCTWRELHSACTHLYHTNYGWDELYV